MNIIINGDPIPQARPRFVRSRGIAYTPAQAGALSWMQQAKEQVKRKLAGALSMTCVFFFRRPKSHYGTGKNAGKLKDSAPEFCLLHKDVDNLVKFVMDNLNGLAYNDDSQIVTVLATKKWSDAASTQIIIKEIENAQEN